MNKINDFIVFGWTHRMLYDGKKFAYCPWCGKKPFEKESEDVRQRVTKGLKKCPEVFIVDNETEFLPKATKRVKMKITKVIKGGL